MPLTATHLLPFQMSERESGAGSGSVAHGSGSLSQLIDDLGNFQSTSPDWNCPIGLSIQTAPESSTVLGICLLRSASGLPITFVMFTAHLRDLRMRIVVWQFWGRAAGAS